MSEEIAPQNLRLTKLEANKIKRVFSDIPYKPYGDQSYIKQLRILAYKHFPDRLLTTLEDLKGNSSSYCIFDNLPIDDVFGSPTGDADSINFKNGYLSENIILAFASIVAEPYSIHFEGKKIVNDLTPHPESTNEYTGLGSKVELDFHIENAAQVYDSRGDTSPLALFLLGLRSDPDVIGPKTYVADSREALKRMTAADIKILSEKKFIIRQPYRWRSHDSENRDTVLHSVLSGPMDQPRVTIAFYPDMVIPVSKEAKTAYDNFYEHLYDVAIGVDIQPGRLVFVNNRFTLHSRENFTPTFDKDGMPYRWVQRVFVTDSLWSFRSFHKQGERIFDPGFSTVK